MPPKKEEIYKRVKIAGMLIFIPFVLAGGIISGYLVGEYLQKKFSLSSLAISIGVLAGTLVSVVEVVKIVRLVLKLDKEK